MPEQASLTKAETPKLTKHIVAVLLTCEGISDAAVVGLRPSKEGDGEERPRAYVVLKEKANVREKERSIVDEVERKVAQHKRLTGGARIVEEIPKSASGKIQRVILKRWAERDANEEEEKLRAKL